MTSGKIPLVKKRSGVSSYVAPLRGDRAREVFDATRQLAVEYEGFPGLDQHFEFDEDAGLIEGSNLAWLVLVNRVLAGDGKRTIDLREARFLRRHRKQFGDGFRRDFGIVDCSPSYGHGGEFKRLIPLGLSGRLKAPVMIHPSSLRIEDGSYVLTGNGSTVIHGNEAMKIFERLDEQALSGVHSLSVARDGRFFATNDGRFYRNSTRDDRIDWFYGEEK